MAVHKLIISGFGGQGVMLMGQMIAYAAMLEDKQVIFLPAYGPEMRGGTANCSVIVSDLEIKSPLVSKADTVVVMNLPSLIKFEPAVAVGGKLFINTSLIEKKTEREDIESIEIEANETAIRLKDIRVSNMVMLGAVIGSTGIVSKESIYEVMEKVFKGSKKESIPSNRKAFEEGFKMSRSEN